MKRFIYKLYKKIMEKGRGLKKIPQEITNKDRGLQNLPLKFFKLKFAVLSIVGIFTYAQPVYASEAITAKITNLYNLVIGIISVVGSIILAWGVFEFATAYQHHDSSQQTQALKKVVAGVLCCSAGAVIALLT